MDKEYSLKVLPKAKSDMENILEYIRDVLKSPQAATKHRKMFAEGLQKIKKDPKLFQHDEFEPLYRWHIVGSYKIYYREFDGKSQVVVFRVLYEKMDHPQHL